jgi:hypothetical protein
MSSAFFALAGTFIGSILSLVTAWVVNQRKARAQWFGHDRDRREDLYKEFIEQAAKCYVDAILHDKPDVPALVILYSKLSRMRVTSSKNVVEAGNRLIKQIIASYYKPSKSTNDLKWVEDDSFDIYPRVQPGLSQRI